jgi:hypothetical protein
MEQRRGISRRELLRRGLELTDLYAVPNPGDLRLAHAPPVEREVRLPGQYTKYYGCRQARGRDPLRRRAHRDRQPGLFPEGAIESGERSAGEILTAIL